MANLRLAGKIAAGFIRSKLTPLTIVAALLLGALAIMKTPREEEPQIIVPMLDVMVQMPGATPQEVEQRVSVPMEKLLREIPGVEYLYSISHPGMSVVIVRFYVGTREEDAIVKTYNKLFSNFDKIPPGASQPIIRVRSIDNVPIMALTLWGAGYDSYRLRLLAGEVEHSIKQIDDVSETGVIGGQPRTIRVVLDTERLAAYGLAPGQVVERLQAANAREQAGSFAQGNREFQVEAGAFLTRAEDLKSVVAGVRNGRPVYLRDVVEKIEDGPAEPSNYVLFASGAGAARGTEAHAAAPDTPAVTITVAKRKGTNATLIAERVLERMKELRGNTLPTDLQLTVTRNYGETAKDKSNELLKHLLLATLSVTLLIALALGWRESGVVLLAVPVTLALTLAIFYLYGYTLNRVTLFALIFSIGILVDDAIVVVENIVRHFRLPENQGRPLHHVAVEAVDEVGNPTILATFTVIAAILPMAFVRGLMGPYMRPIPVGASAAMVFSLAVAFVVSPWAALRLLRHYASAETGSHAHATEGWMTRLYRRIMEPLIASGRRRTIFLAGIVVLLLAACTLVPLKLVHVKMLPFDNKSEFQVIIDMPDGTPLEQTTRVAQELGAFLARQPEIVNYQIYSGTAGPYNFNGLVRHYYLRSQPNQADIQVNLLPRSERSTQSHEIARRLRPGLQEIAQRLGARIKVSEVPPGPPVLQTLVAEVYGPDYKGQTELAQKIKDIFQHTPGVVDVDWYVEDPQPKFDMRVDLDKAALHGVSAGDVSRTVAIALHGAEAGLLHSPLSREDVPIQVRLGRADRSSMEGLEHVKLPSGSGAQVSLGEVTNTTQTVIDQSVYRKNMQPVVYVTGDVAGEEESPVYAILRMNRTLDQLTLPQGYTIARYNAVQPPSTDRYAMKWDGEWHITIEVFRDLGLAFAVVLVLIYVLVVGWFKSFATPLVIMAPIPLTLVGILPAHALMGAFFTATSMIGFIAGAGIIVRNSIILVDFIELRRSHGVPLAQAVVDAGAVRFRPMLLTAAAVVVGASVILFDPIFQGLAISLMAGEVASTLLSRMAVPVLYYLSQRRHEHHMPQKSVGNESQTQEEMVHAHA
ncbi:MAG TPA: efflux RND transporter permease subunit [Candidatus Angelobacter sp.]|nr:efflux RND transporter permease subunit [Candidatus Angelobacter sp.]